MPRMAPSYAANPACSFLALTNIDEDEKILAVANYKRLESQKSGWIEAVRTHPDHRNQGLASSLLRSIIDLADQEDENDNDGNAQTTNVLTCTVASNKGMLRAFEKVGFVQSDTIQILKFETLKDMEGWEADCDKMAQPLLDALDMNHLVSPTAKAISSSSSWCTITDEGQLLKRLKQCKNQGCSGYVPGLYEYIVPGQNRLDLKDSMEHGLVLALDDVHIEKETSSCEPECSTVNKCMEDTGQAILVFTRDERISSLKSNWVCSIVAHTQLAFEAAVWHAHSAEVARLMRGCQRKDGNADYDGGNDAALPFCLVFDNAIPRAQGTLACELPRVTDQCVVFSYQR